MKLLSLKKLEDFEMLYDWCLSIYDFLVTLHPDFSFETEYYKGVIAKAKVNSDLKMLRRVYKETNLMVRETLTPDLIEVLNKLLKKKFGCSIADEIDKEKNVIQKIIKRGEIRNNQEFELVKRREEEIWQDDDQIEYAETLRRLMRSYEG